MGVPGSWVYPGSGTKGTYGLSLFVIPLLPGRPGTPADEAFRHVFGPKPGPGQRRVWGFEKQFSGVNGSPNMRPIY